MDNIIISDPIYHHHCIVRTINSCLSLVRMEKCLFYYYKEIETDSILRHSISKWIRIT